MRRLFLRIRQFAALALSAAAGVSATVLVAGVAPCDVTSALGGLIGVPVAGLMVNATFPER